MWKFNIFEQTLKNSFVRFVSFVVKKVFAVDSSVLHESERDTLVVS